MDLAEGGAWDAVLEGVWGLASVAVLLPGLTWASGEEGFRDVATSSMVLLVHQRHGRTNKLPIQLARNLVSGRAHILPIRQRHPLLVALPSPRR